MCTSVSYGMAWDKWDRTDVIQWDGMGWDGTDTMGQNNSMAWDRMEGWDRTG